MLQKELGNPILVSKICNIHDSASLVLDVANLGQEDRIPSSLLQQCGDRFYYSRIFRQENPTECVSVLDFSCTKHCLSWYRSLPVTLVLSLFACLGYEKK